MLRSLYSGISGLKNHQIRMDTIGNNISNVNTTGFKSGQANFQDALVETIQSGGSGRNPAQVGLGTTLAGITNDFSNGGLLDTGRDLDLAIQGNGFFVLKDPDTEIEYYSRDGKFFFDDEGYLVNSSGFRVQSTDGDIKVYNGPVDSISIASDGTITGTNSEGLPLQLSSTPITIPDPIPPQEAELTGETLTGSFITLEEARIAGSAISVVNGQLQEAILRGNSASPEAAPLGISSEPIDMSSYDLILTYNDGQDDFNVDLSSNLESVTSWQDLADQLQQAIDSDVNLAGKVKVHYDSGNNGGLVFETVTDPDEKNSKDEYITPSITLGGAGVEKYMGDVTTLSATGEPVNPKDWTGKKFLVDVGSGWQEVKLVDNFKVLGGPDKDTGLDNVTSGTDLANKLQNLLNFLAGDDPSTTTIEGKANISVSWDTDHLVFETRGTIADGSTIPTIKIEGEDAVEFIGSSSKSDTGINSPDWSSKDISINYNGTLYYFSSDEKKTAGFDNITSGTSLANALQTLIDNKIGTDKVTVAWDNGKLHLATINTGGTDVEPTILIGGADAADFIGENPVIVEGTSGIQPEPQADTRQIKLVAFNNPEGLIRAGNNLFTASDAAQEKSVDHTSLIQSGFLEMSNVDLTDQFTDMITTQRGYQASSRIITVSDTMLEELINLKR